MSDSKDRTTAEIVQQAIDLIATVQRQLEAYDAFFHARGLNRQKVCALLKAKMGPAEHAKVKKLVRADLEAVKQEVAQEMRHRGLAQGGSETVKRLRIAV